MKRSDRKPGSHFIISWQYRRPFCSCLRTIFTKALVTFCRAPFKEFGCKRPWAAGIGRFLKNTNRSRITLMGGLAWQSTDYHQSDVPQPAQNVVSGLIALDLNLFRFSKTNLNVTANLFPALSDPGRLRFNTNASYFVRLFGDLSWTITFYGNWDTKPPPHFSGSDYGTSSGLSWSFGR